MESTRFKIDRRKRYFTCPIGLYVLTRGLFGEYWKELSYFPDVKAAREEYEMIKDLPEYLP